MKIYAMYFSPTGTTKKIVETVAGEIARAADKEVQTIDFTLPSARAESYQFTKDDLVVFGTPVYAGRVPNVLLKFLSTVTAQKALAVPVVLFGNRSYDDALMELKLILEENGFQTIAAGGFVGEHSFSYELAAGRPDGEDITQAVAFADKITKKLKAGDLSTVIPNGNNPIGPYYQPRSKSGEPVDIRKVKPKTAENCIDCKICAKACPMGSISFDDVKEYIGICIKCGACVKKCPVGAKFYDDYNYLYHKKELEEDFERRAKVEYFV